MRNIHTRKVNPKHKRGGYSGHTRKGSAESGGGFGVILCFVFIVIVVIYKG